MCLILQVCCLTLLVAEAAVGNGQGWQQFETVENLLDSEWQPQVCSPSVLLPQMLTFLASSVLSVFFFCFWQPYITTVFQFHVSLLGGGL